MKKFVVLFISFLFFSINTQALNKGSIVIESTTGEILMDDYKGEVIGAPKKKNEGGEA